jgi:hypothetical protein
VETHLGNRHSGKRERAQWKIVETKVKDDAAVQVSELPLKIPRYSFKVGTAQLDEETGDMRIGSRLTVFNVEDAAVLLTALADKYVKKRKARIKEIEDKKAAWAAKQNTD